MMGRKMSSRFTKWAFCTFLVYVGVSNAQNISETTGATQDNENASPTTENPIDLETLSMFGVSAEFAEQFRLNLIKAIEAETGKGPDGQPLRQEFFQGGPGGGGVGAEEEDEEEEDEMVATTQGPGAFGVLSGIFGIFSGLGSLNPSRIVQSTVNFFPPGQRMMAQKIVDSLIGYTPPENRTLRPRPRPRRTTTITPLPISEVMMPTGGSQMPMEAPSTANGTAVPIVSKQGESTNGTSEVVDAMSEVINALAPETTTPEPDFINVHELLNRTTIPPPPPNEDDEIDFDKRDMLRVSASRPNSSSSGTLYKLKPKPTAEEEKSSQVPLNVTTVLPPSP